MAVDPLDSSVTEALRAWRFQHSAGIEIGRALETCGPICDFAQGRECFRQAAERAGQGAGIESMLDAFAPLFSEAERATLNAGWKSGRIEAAMDAVIAEREVCLRARSVIRSKMLLPAAVLVMAAFIAPFPRFFSGGSTLEYILSAGVPLGVALALWQFGGSLLRARRFDSTLLALPLLGRLEKQRSLSEFAGLLGNLIGAGLTMSAALEICARAVSNSVYRREIARCVPVILAGSPLSSALKPGELWPVEFLSVLAAAERAGALEESLARAGRRWREEYVRTVEIAADWLPRVAYACVALFVIYNIFRMVAGIAGMYPI